MSFTTLALDRLIEPKDSKPMAPGKSVSDSRLGVQINGTTDKPPDSRNSTKTTDKKHYWTQISPALYATPEPTPLPDSPSSFAPSPYIVNHKRRGPRLSKALSEDDAAVRQALADEKTNDRVRSLEAEDIESCSVVNDTDNVHESVEDTHSKFVDSGDPGNDIISNNTIAGQDNLDDFFDPQDSLSVSSSIDQDSSSGLGRSLNLNSSVSEFYDAWEELSSESGSQILSNDVEAELREARVSLLAEIEKRKQAEDCINEMRSQWGRIHQHLSFVGLSLPEDPIMLKNHSEDDLEEELTRQIHVIRFVSNSIGRGIAKAEIEAEMETQLESKNFEIARLLDRLRYYEAVNHEMSQRNQETIESVRRVRQRRKRRQRWIWSSIVAAVTIGSAALAWSYLPTGKGSSLADPDPPSQTCEGSSHSA